MSERTNGEIPITNSRGGRAEGGGTEEGLSFNFQLVLVGGGGRTGAKAGEEQGHDDQQRLSARSRCFREERCHEQRRVSEEECRSGESRAPGPPFVRSPTAATAEARDQRVGEDWSLAHPHEGSCYHPLYLPLSPPPPPGLLLSLVGAEPGRLPLLQLRLQHGLLRLHLLAGQARAGAHPLPTAIRDGR